MAHISTTANNFDLQSKSVYCFSVTAGLIQAINAPIQASFLRRLIRSQNRFVFISLPNFWSSDVSKRCYNHWFIDLLRYSNLFFPVTAGRFCSIQLPFKSIGIANAYPSELFQGFFQQRHDVRNFQKKAKNIDQFRDWISFFRNYGLESCHESHSQNPYTWGTWFDWIIVLFVPAFKALIVLLLHTLLMI